MLGIEPWVSHMLSTSSTTGVIPSPKKGILKAGRWGKVVSGPRGRSEWACKRCRWVGGQTDRQGVKGIRRRGLAREEGPTA